MRTYTQAEIDELIASGEVDRMVERARELRPGDVLIDGPHLIALSDVALRPQSTEEQIDDAVWAARCAGHTWAEIEPVLHLCLHDADE